MPALQCTGCQTPHDLNDQFCRKCGATLAQEAAYSEIAEVQTGEVSPDQAVTVVNVNHLTNTNQVTELAPTGKSALRSLTSTVGSKIGRAIQSEQGKKVVRGATALAVAVGVELLTQATNKNRSTPVTRQGKALPPSLSLADSLIRSMEEEMANRPDDADVEEVYIRERLYIRRTIRRRQK